MRKTFIILGAFFTLLSIVFTALPLGTLAILPIGIAIALAYLALKKSTDTEKKYPKILLIISVICLLTVIGKEIFTKEEVAQDVQFEQTIEKSQQEDKKELEELESLEGDLE